MCIVKRLHVLEIENSVDAIAMNGAAETTTRRSHTHIHTPNPTRMFVHSAYSTLTCCAPMPGQMKSAVCSHAIWTPQFSLDFMQTSNLLVAATAADARRTGESKCDNKTKLLESHLSEYTHKHWVLFDV